MKQLYSSVALAREYKKELRAFHKQIFNTLEYWLLPKIKGKDSLDDDILLKEGDYIKNKENLYLGSLKIDKIEKDYYLATDVNGIQHRVKKDLVLRAKTPTLPYSKTDTLQTRLTKVKSNLESLSEDFGKVFISKQIYKFIKNIDKNFKQDIGIDFKKIENTFSQEMKEKIQLIYESNMSLIKSIPRDIITSLEPALLNVSIEGDQAMITKTLSRLKATSAKRINTIARDQTSKGLSAIAALRATQAGFEYYEWRTAKDERVSSGYGGHDKLNKKIFRYDTAEAIIDSYGNKGHPAQRVNCLPEGQGIDFIYFPKNLFRFNIGGEFSKLIFDDGSFLITTGEHKVLASTNEWICVDSLKKGDKVIKLHTNEIKFNHNKVYICQIFNYIDELCSYNALSFKNRGITGDFDTDVGVDETTDIIDINNLLRYIGKLIYKQVFTEYGFKDSRFYDIFVIRDFSFLTFMDRKRLLYFTFTNFLYFFSKDTSAFSSIKSDNFITDFIQAIHDDVPIHTEILQHFKNTICDNSILFNLFYIYVFFIGWSVTYKYKLYTPRLDDIMNNTLNTCYIDYQVVEKIEKVNIESRIYSLETDLGYYTIDNIINKNCRCVSIPIFIEPNQKVVKDTLGYKIINNN